tara:strand:+ start:641 stop:1150 length:510 start_codon:yes stop_codon:yes gene_type:complete
MIQGNIITIDAMGTQTDISQKIIKNKAAYILAVKENQKQLLEEIIDAFKFSKDIEIDTNIDMGHGRIETRNCSVISDFLFFENKNHKWKNLKQAVKVENIREFKNSDKLTENATRYYLSSLENNANEYQKNIRSHWGVENKLHWVLEIAFLKTHQEKGTKTQLKIIQFF